MSQIPLRSVRLNARPATTLESFVGTAGEIFYDSTNQTLRVYPGNIAAGKILADRDWVNSAIGDIGTSSLVNGTRTVSLSTAGSLTIPGDIRSESNINIDINLADSTLRRWQFGEDGILTLPSVGKISNGAYDWTFGSTGITTFPGVINAGNINNLVVNDLGGGTSLTAGSQVQIGNSAGIAGAGVLIKNAVTNALGGESSLEQGSKIQMDNGIVSLSGYTYNGIGGGEGTEFQMVVEVENNYPNKVVRIGTRIINTIGESTTNVFQGVTISQYGELTFPDNTVQSTAYDPSSIRSEGNINIDINLSDSTLRRWQFGEDGILTAPGAIDAPSIFTNLIDSADSSAITMTPAVIFNSDVTVENDLVAKNIVFLDNSVQTTAWTGSLNNPTFTGTTTLQQITEVMSPKTGATGVVVHDFSTTAIFYHTSPAANFTINITNVPTTVNRVTTVVLIITQGVTGYYPNVLQIDGVSQTINWIGNVTPTPSASRNDIVSFTLIRTAAPSWIVTGAITGY